METNEQAGEGLLTSESQPGGESSGDSNILTTSEGNGDNQSSGDGTEGTPAATRRENIYGYEKMLSEELRGHPALEGLDEPNKLVKSYIALKEQVGRNLTPPGEDATDDERHDFLRKAGLPAPPQTQEDYVFEDPEGTQPMDMGWWRDVAFRNGLPTAAANQVQFEWRAAQAKGNQKIVDDALGDMLKRKGEIRPLVGGTDQAMEQQRMLGERAVQHYIQEADGSVNTSLVAMLKEMKWHGVHATSHPDFHRLFARIGADLVEHKVLRSDAESGDTPKKEKYPGLDKI